LTAFDEAFPYFGMFPNTFANQSLHHDDDKTGKFGEHGHRLNNSSHVQRGNG